MDAGTLELDAGMLLPGFDAGMSSPGNLALADGSAIGPIDAGLALSD